MDYNQNSVTNAETKSPSTQPQQVQQQWAPQPNPTKFYEGKIGMGILYLFTGGLFVIGVIIDLIAILGKPNPYFV